MGKRCPKCNYVAANVPIVCPACGVIYSKIENATDANSVKTLAPPPEPTLQQPSATATQPRVANPVHPAGGVRRSHTKRRALYALGILVVAIVLGNYLFLQRHLSDIIAADPRNGGVTAAAHYEFYIVPSSVVFDLRDISAQTSMLDVSRVLLQFAASRKDSEYERVTLSFRGEPKFLMKGDYFRTLGAEYGPQNPIYTLRTMPEHMYRMDGTQAFGTWTGGLLGVLGKQMEDFNELHKQWYVSDLAREVRP
jgi:hypothetical protein